MKRAVHQVKHLGQDIEFKGLLFGIHPGCWIVSKKDAKRLCEAYGYRLPRCGYDRMLDDTGRNFVSNYSNAEYRVWLQRDQYDYTQTGEFE